MAAGAGVVELCSAKPKLSLAKLMDGELADLDLGDEGLFGYAEFEVLGPEALEESQETKAGHARPLQKHGDALPRRGQDEGRSTPEGAPGAAGAAGSKEEEDGRSAGGAQRRQGEDGAERGGWCGFEGAKCR
eukprot:7028295-Pyramimonas_sp.AAC.1